MQSHEGREERAGGGERERQRDRKTLKSHRLSTHCSVITTRGLLHREATHPPSDPEYTCKNGRSNNVVQDRQGAGPCVSPSKVCSKYDILCVHPLKSVEQSPVAGSPYLNKPEI